MQRYIQIFAILLMLPCAASGATSGSDQLFTFLGRVAAEKPEAYNEQAIASKLANFEQSTGLPKAQRLEVLTTGLISSGVPISQVVAVMAWLESNDLSVVNADPCNMYFYPKGMIEERLLKSEYLLAVVNVLPKASTAHGGAVPPDRMQGIGASMPEEPNNTGVAQSRPIDQDKMVDMNLRFLMRLMAVISAVENLDAEFRDSLTKHKSWLEKELRKSH